MEKETLEEASERAIKSGLFKDKTLFIAGAKWQAERMYSEEDMRRALSAGLSIGYGRQFEIENKQVEIDSYMKSLQQTEWDVVVEMDIDNPCPKCGEKDNVHGNYDYSNITRPLINTLCNECGTYFSPIPKLDADGCLILKRK